MHQRRIAQCVWPQSCVHCRWQLLACMQELLSGAFREVLDGTLGNSILEMHIDPAEGELLLVLLACLLECIVRKSTIVAMVVFDGYTVLGSKSLKCFFCFYCFVGRQVLHQMDVLKAGEMVDEDGCGTVPLGGEFAF